MLQENYGEIWLNPKKMMKIATFFSFSGGDASIFPYFVLLKLTDRSGNFHITEFMINIGSNELLLTVIRNGMVRVLIKSECHFFRLVILMTFCYYNR